jgi:predicted nucleic-acid-binding protein
VKGLDTSVLVRYLVQDDPDQSPRASDLIETAASDGEKLRIASIVLCETVWVLGSAYDAKKHDLLAVLDKLLATRQFEIEHRHCARAALEDYRSGKADFSDGLIGRINRAAGCESTFSFDQTAAAPETFTLL